MFRRTPLQDGQQAEACEAHERAEGNICRVSPRKTGGEMRKCQLGGPSLW
jgi:hypothetical protein